jgi:hypothetical protein
MKKVHFSLLFWLVIAFVLMVVLGFSGVIIWDKLDWIFLFLLVGLIVLNVKANKIIELLSKKKK